MITVKLSHSILDAWAHYRYEDAVAMYLGKPLPPTPAMELGRLKAQIWEDDIKTLRRLPDELGGDPLNNPIPEQKLEKVIPLGDDYQILLRGVPDCLDRPIIWEFKCGLTKPVTYVDKMQTPYYKLLVPEATEARYRCFNPYSGEVTTGIRFLDDRDAEEALEHIITFGSEMINYLTAEKLIINYKPEVYAKA